MALTTTLSLSASSQDVAYGTQLILTATVSSTAQVNEGTVTFTSGGTTLGSSPVTGGVAALSISSLPTGTNTVAASYTDTVGNFAASAITPGIITTIAGTGTGGYSGDGSAATAAELNSPYGIAVDSAGDIFIADSSNNRIREITTSGEIITIAGTGTAGSLGDGGKATAAELNFPVGVALDSAGDLFIADQNNNRIREINHLTGIITTVAGSSNFQTGSQGDGGLATAAYLNSATAVAVDSAGDIFIADGSSRVREVNATSGIITTVAGNGTSGFAGDGGLATAAELSSPDGLALDSAGDLFIADSNNNRVREVNHLTGIITTVAGGGASSSNNGDGGPATAANLSLSNNTGLAVDTAGDLFIADVFHSKVREVSAQTGIITTVAGGGSGGNGGPATAASLSFPHGEAFDSAGDLYVDEQGASRIRAVSGGLVVTVSAAPSVLNASDAGGTYDGSPFAATATVNGTTSLEGVTPSLTYYSGSTASGAALTGAPTAAGTYSVVASFAGSTDYTAGASTPLAFVISPASLTVTASSTSMSYGGPLPMLGGSISGEVAGDGITASFSTTATIQSQVKGGGYPITGTLSDPNHKLSNYTVTYVAGTLTVTPVPLTITANNLFMTAGSAVPTLTASYAGFVNGDSPASMTTLPALSTTATSSSPASATPYPITVGGAADPNYSFTYITGGLTITNLATPAVTVSDSSGTYNGSGFVATATVNGSASLAGVVPQIRYYSGANSGGTPLPAAPTNAGTYTIVASYAGSTDYNPAPSSPLTLVISPALLTVTANNASKVYGAAVPGLTGSIGGEVAGDGITASFNTTATAASHVQAGGYPITATLSDPDGKLANYAVSYVSGTLTVAPAPLTVTANNATKAYLAAVPALSVSYAGLVNGDTTASLTTPPSVTTTATTGSTPGQYPITASGAVDPDYAITYVAGTLTVFGAPTSVSLVGSPLSLSFGQVVSLTATVSSQYSVNEGTVSFLLGSTTLGSAAVSGNTASIELSTLPGGTDTVTAVYSDPGGFFAGSGSTISTNSLITALAGNGTSGNSGNNGLATAAEFDDPHGVAVDSAGDVFIADHNNNIVWEVNHATGIITIVAGDGNIGYSGDGGQATAAELWAPEGLAVDSSGNLYICDGENSRIREVNHVTGIITTVAGGANFGYSGDGGPATAAELQFEKAVAVDSAGDIFIADWGNGRVREVNHVTGIITTIAGGGTGSVGGPATAASLSYPDGVAVDSAGDVYIADIGRITEVNAATGIITSVATTSGFYNPGAIALDSAGDLFVPDTSNNEIWELSVDGQFSVVAGSGTSGFLGNGGPATAARFNDPWGVAVDAQGDLYVTDSNNNQVREISSGTTVAVSPGHVTPTLSVTDSGGAYTGSGYLATATVNGSASLEGVTPAISYYSGTSSLGTALGGAPSTLGTYTAVASFAGSTDYVAATGSTSFTITKAGATIVLTDGGGPYTGSAYSATATIDGSASLEGITPTISYYSGTSALGTALSGAPSAVGTYTAVASFAGSTDYATATGSTTFTITKSAVTFTVTDNGGTFTGSPFTASTQSIEGVTPSLWYYSGTATSGTASSSAPSSAGTYSVLASFAGSTDYSSGLASTTFTIAKDNPNVSVTDMGGNFNGSPFPASASAIEGVTPSLWYYSGTAASGTASSSAPSSAGTYSVLASFAGSADYTSGVGSATFTIAKVNSAILVVDTGGTYNAAAFSAATNTIEGVSPALFYYSGTAASGTALAGAPSTVGTYSVLASFGGSTDYNTASASTSFSISKATASVGINIPTRQPWVAGVFSQSAQASSLEGITPLAVYYSGTAASGTALSGAPSAQGTYTALISFAGSTDYNSAANSVTFTVNTAVPAVAVSDPGGVYSGSAYSATATVNGSASLESVTPTLSYYSGTAASGTALSGAPSHAGTYTVVASFAGSTDYSAAQSNPATFVISPAPLKITADSQTMPYGGPVPTLTASYSGFVGNDSAASLTVQPLLSTTATSTSTINPGNPYPITVSGAVDPDYTISYVAGQLTITSALPPTSSINVLGYRTTATSILVSWSGTAGTGGAIQSYTIDVTRSPVGSTDFTAWQSLTTSQTSTLAFPFVPGYVYDFYSQVTDAAGVQESAHTTADTSVTVVSSVWTYAGNPLNVIGLASGDIVPADALAVIDYLNLNPGGASLPATAPESDGYYDVLGQDNVVPADALTVIDYLNLHPAAQEVAPAVAAPAVASPSNAAAPATAGLEASPSASSTTPALTPAVVDVPASTGGAAPLSVGPALMAVGSLPAAAAIAAADAANDRSPLAAPVPAAATAGLAPRGGLSPTAAGPAAIDLAFSTTRHNWWDE